MKLKTLEIENIRSYDKLTVIFPDGTILFEGATGSGKSTLLMAIEFALFGLGSIRGSSLLRLGTDKGSVKLNFEIEENQYEVFRTLERKAKSIRQGSGYIIEPSGKLDLEPSELKHKILEILHFNEPEDPKAQSWIYRYAVFTPQEEMKAILSYKPDIRLEILRKAFRLEEYKTAIENTQTLTQELNNKIIELKAQTKDLEIREKQHNEKQGEKKKTEQFVTELKSKESKIQTQLKEFNTRLDKLQEANIKLARANTEITQLNSKIESDRLEKEELQKEEEQSKKELEQIKTKISKSEKPKKPTKISKNQIEKDIENLENKQAELRKIENQLEAKIKDYKKIEKEKKCPTCDRKTTKDFREIVKNKKIEWNKAQKDAEEASEKLKQSRELLRKLETYLTNKEKYESITREKKHHLQLINKGQIKIKTLESRIQTTNQRLEELTTTTKELTNIEEKITELKEDKTKKQEESKEIGEQIASGKQKIESLSREIEDLSKEIETMKKDQRDATILSDYHFWLRDYFIKTLETIEKQVMTSINQEFNHEFDKWFTILIEDPTKEATIDEDFTPIIKQDGYDQNVEFLSGGEKTSVALAYRLALNSIVQQVSVGIKSNILIMDEPTDGFSKEQLYKVREILNELQCPQVILVSHETELESFADHIYRIGKAGGISKIQKPAS